MSASAAVHKGLPVLHFATEAEWDAWLVENGGRVAGIWLKLAKKGSGANSVTKAEAIVAAICHGWIDGQINPLDEQSWLIRFTPRGPRSKWSRRNRETAAGLIVAGRMSEAGRREVERAKADGRWQAAYAPQSSADVPPDLAAALDKTPAAKAFFATLTGANRYAVLYRVHDAKRPDTRAKRIAKFVEMLAAGETVHGKRARRSP